MIFPASPYRDPDFLVRAWRYEQALQFCAAHLLQDLKHRPIYSPIVYTHPLAELEPRLHDKDTAFWMAFHRPYLEICDELWVLALPGWRESEEIAAEIALVKEFGRPVLSCVPSPGDSLGRVWDRIA